MSVILVGVSGTALRWSCWDGSTCVRRDDVYRRRWCCAAEAAWRDRSTDVTHRSGEHDIVVLCVQDLGDDSGTRPSVLHGGRSHRSAP